MICQLLSAAMISASPIAGGEVIEETVVNEIEHALQRAPDVDVGRSIANVSGNPTEVALKLVRTQRSDGRWLDGTNDVTASAVTALKRLIGIPDAVPHRWTFDEKLSDEFDGGAIDESKWYDFNPTFYGRRAAGFLFSRDCVAVSNGCLRLTARLLKESEKTPENLARGYDRYATSIVKSKTGGGYGYYECRAKAARGCVSNAFWMYDPHADNLKAKYSPGDFSEEIDIFEICSKKDFRGRYDCGRMLYNTVHACLTPYLEATVSIGQLRLADKSGMTRLAFAPDEEFHVYSLLWTKDEMVFYLDGVETFRRANDRFHRPLRVSFDTEIMSSWFGEPDPADMPSVFEVDYFRVWHPQISGSK